MGRSGLLTGGFGKAVGGIFRVPLVIFLGRARALLRKNRACPSILTGCLSSEKTLMHPVPKLNVCASEVLTSMVDKKIARKWKVVHYGAPHGRSLVAFAT